LRKEQLIQAKTEQLDALLAMLNQDLEEAGCPPDVVVSVGICAEEIFVNVAHYGYPDGEGKVLVIEEIEENRITLELQDWGTPYDPLEREDPDITLSAEERQIGGLGIFMVRNMMDGVSYEYRDEKNCLKMWKEW
jgi:anti-sigma regulatory factor (Ser/Thr protein kinase)